MIRALAWGWLFWRHRAAVRRGWRWGQGKDVFARMIRDHRAELNLISWDDDRTHAVIHRQFIQSAPPASIQDR